MRKWAGQLEMTKYVRMARLGQREWKPMDCNFGPSGRKLEESGNVCGYFLFWRTSYAKG